MAARPDGLLPKKTTAGFPARTATSAQAEAS